MYKLLSIFSIVYVMSFNNLLGEHYVEENFIITCKGIGKEKLMSGENITSEWETEFDFLISVESFLAKSSNRELSNIRVGATKRCIVATILQETEHILYVLNPRRAIPLTFTIK